MTLVCSSLRLDTRSEKLLTTELSSESGLKPCTDRSFSYKLTKAGSRPVRLLLSPSGRSIPRFNDSVTDQLVTTGSVDFSSDYSSDSGSISAREATRHSNLPHLEQPLLLVETSQSLPEETRSKKFISGYYGYYY